MSMQNTNAHLNLSEPRLEQLTSSHNELTATSRSLVERASWLLEHDLDGAPAELVGSNPTVLQGGSGGGSVHAVSVLTQDEAGLLNKLISAL
jgi:hypothetical protein